MLEDYAVLALSDHGHAPLLPKNRYVDLRTIPGQIVSSGVKARFGNGTTVVVVPNGRSALLYLRGDVELEPVVDTTRRAPRRGPRSLDGRRVGDRPPARTRSSLSGQAREPGDPFGRSWDLEGDPLALDIEVSDGLLRYGDYPDALERLWGCLHSPRCGDVVLSATPGYTFGEISGGYHTASDHGSLHASDSNVFVLASGVPAPRRITDVAPTLLSHFGADAGRRGPCPPGSSAPEERTGLRPRYRRAFGCVTWVYMGMLVFLAGQLPPRAAVQVPWKRGASTAIFRPGSLFSGRLLILPGMALAAVLGARTFRTPRKRGTRVGAGVGALIGYSGFFGLDGSPSPSGSNRRDQAFRTVLFPDLGGTLAFYAFVPLTLVATGLVIYALYSKNADFERRRRLVDRRGGARGARGARRRGDGLRSRSAFWEP